jgi:hypothetical protein
MVNTSEQPVPTLKFDDMLLSNARLASRYYESELRFSGYNTPKVLFSGVHGKGADVRFQADALNPQENLMWFSPTLKLAANFGTRLSEEQPEGIDPSQRDDSTKYVFVIFPHETGDLGKWVFQETPRKDRPIYEYITNQNMPLDSTVVARLDMLLQVRDEIRPTIATRKALLEALGTTDEQQRILREKLKVEVQRPEA